ncbi:transcription factor TFIIIB component B'' homolog isoform X2 [Onychostoma macrolepis]|uniref:Myb-like domain-containing protein n=1 Tax=Onychostoma macrolepis TaxID=369639 RepID=A0A7J6D1F8_9TELE|nr:transcription factor TFIIIB component B'' homolog isoform X2 [Onychostoma macrolepis]KAF4113014.1 hypothetical protein G5714_005559 [Onychostoma macrolepis]
MRRARISIKPNVRPGGRSVAPTAENNSSQGSTAVDDTQQKLSSSPQSQLEVKESAVATGDGNVPGSPSEKASLNINDGAPSSVSTPATTVLHRRSRISATPNLARPKVRSAPPSEPSKTSSPFQAAKSFPHSSIPVAISRDDSQNSTFSDATTAANCPPSSPCLPSTSGCPESPSSTPSQQEPCRIPQKIPNEDFGPQEGATPISCTLSPYVKLSRVDGPDSPLRNKISSDKQQVLRALKLKELMKLERKKERTEKKSRQHKHEHCIEPDHDKMTLADFIYYLPEANPMKSSLSTEETQTQITAPPTPTVQKNMAEADEEEDDDADEELLVPKVRVAEDGSLILDEESLTVRIQRTSDTVVENANPLFERGSTTTYTSFRKKCHVKSWSVRETDMFYLAISMVGTDFSMIAQLLTHRSRAEIKNKFKKEEKANSWRVDKAFRNKRPYDSELFSFLLKRVLAKDKQKGKSIKLVVKSSKAKKSKGGKKSKQLEDKDSLNDDELCSVDSVCFDLEKENEDSSNMNEADVPSSTSKKRKRTKDTEPKVLSCEKAPKKGKCLLEAEDSDLMCVDNDSVNADNEDQSCMSVSKKKCKQTKKGDQEGKEVKTEEKQKTKKNKKTHKVLNEEPTDGENGAVNDECNEASAIQTKKRKRSKKCEKEEQELTKCKLKTKKSKTSQQECTGSELGADCNEDPLTDPGAEDDQGEKLYPERATKEEVSQSSTKHSKRPNLAKRKAKKCSEPKATVEIEDTAEECQDKSCSESENELRIIHLAEKQLQNQPVVVLERTPPRLKDSHSSSESQDQPQTSQSPQHSPGRQMRAEKVKRNLTASGDAVEVSTAGPGVKEDQGVKLVQESSTKEEISQSFSKHSPGWRTRAEKVKHNLTAAEGNQIDQCHTGSHPSPVEMSSTAMLNQLGIQDSKEMEADQRIEEDLNLHHLEFLTPSEVNGQTLLTRAVVLVSHDEVKHYLRSQAQTTAEESTSETPQDMIPARGHHVGEHRDGLDEHCSSSGVLEQSVSQDQDVKETDTASISAQLSIAEKRRRIFKPKPSLSRAAQSIRRPLNENTSSFIHDSTQLQCSSPEEVQVKIAPNECLVEAHRDRPEEELTCSVTPEVSGLQNVKDDEAETTVDDLPSLTSIGSTPIVSKTEDQEIVPFLEKPLVPDTTPSDKDVPERREFERSPSQTSENEDRITDQEGQDSETVESEVKDTMIEEPQTELKRVVPVSCSADGSSVYAQDSVAPERSSQFDKQTPTHLEGASLVMINPQKTSEPNEDPAEKPEHKSPVKAKHSDLDHAKEKISREDKLLSSEENLQEHKQDEDLLSPVPLLSLKQTCTGKGNKEQNDPVLSDASSALFEAHSPVSSFSDPTNEPASNLCDMDLMQFSESAAEDIQIPNKQDSENQDHTEEPSEASEECIASLNENSKSAISDSAGVDKGAVDEQSEEEPTFILTLYEIPASQLFHEAAFGQQDTPPNELQPAQVQTPLLFSSSSHSHSFTSEPSSASLNMVSEETSNLCKSSPRKVVDDFLDPLSKEAADDASTQLISSQESSRDDVNSLISPPGMFSCNSATPTHVPKSDEVLRFLTESPETKAPTQRRCKIKVKPKLKPCVKAGPSRNGQFDCTPSQNLPTSQATAQTEIESKQKISAQETVGPESHSSLEDSEREAHHGPDGVISTAIVPVSEDMRDESERPLRTELHRNEDSVVDPPVHSTFIKESEGNNEAGYESISHTELADAFVLSSGEMKDVFNKEKESPHDSELQKPEGLSVCLTESEKALPAIIDQEEKMADISKKPDTCREASCVSSSASQEKTVPFRRGKLQVKPKILKTTSTQDDCSRQKLSDFGCNDPATTQIISPEPLIKEESIKVEQRSEQEDFSDIPKEELDREPAGIASSSQLQQLIPFSIAKTTAHTELQPVELKIEGRHEDVSHVVLPDILVPVSAEMEDGDHMASGSSVQSSLQIGEESQQVVAAEANQEMHSHDGVSHMLLTDMLIPVCEKMEDDLSKEWTTAGEKSPHEEGRSQVREDPDTADLFCQISQSSNVGPSVSPKRKRATQGKGKLLVKMPFPKRKTGDSPKSGEQSHTVPLSILMLESAQCSAKTCADLVPTGSEDHEEASGGVSHIVLSDILVPVMDETAESGLHKEALSAGLQEDAVKVEKTTDIERPANTEIEEMTASQSVAVEWKTPCCRRGTLHPIPKLSKRKDDPSENDLCQPSSTQTSVATPQQSLDPQAVEWSLKSNMLPMDSDEMENWCEGVSHMLLSDAFVPVSEETGENSTELKVFVLSSPHKDEQIGFSPTKSEETPSEISSDVHQLNTTSDMPKSNESLPASQAKKSPARSTFQMTLRSPERSLKDQPHMLKPTQAAPTTPQRTQTSKVKESMGTPTRQQTGEISSACRVQLERLSVEEICSAQSVLQPKHHSTPVTVKPTSRGSEMDKASLVLHGSRTSGLESHADEEPPMPPGYSPRVVLHRIPLTATDENTSTPTLSPARMSTTTSRTLADHQSPQNSPPVSGLDADKNPDQVSHFLLDDIFTEVVDPD